MEGNPLNVCTWAYTYIPSHPSIQVHNTHAMLLIVLRKRGVLSSLSLFQLDPFRVFFIR